MDDEFLRFQAEIGSLVEAPADVGPAPPPAASRPAAAAEAVEIGPAMPPPAASRPAVQVIAAKPAAATRRADADEYAGYGGYSGGYGGGYGGGSGAAPGVGAGMGYGGAVATYGSAYDLPNNAAAPPPVYAPPAAAPVAAPAGGGGSGAAAASASAATAAAAGGKALNDKQKRKLKVLRTGAGEKWMDPTMNEWPDNDFRIFCGDLGNEVTDEVLSSAFRRYKSFAKAKVVRDKWSRKSKGFGFVSFLDANDAAVAMREMQGKYVGNRPIKIRKSTWQERSLKVVQEKEKKDKKEKRKLEALLQQ